MKKIWFCALAVLLAFVFISCSQEVLENENLFDEDLVGVRLHTTISEGKGLDSDASATTYKVTTYKYEAIPTNSNAAKGKTTGKTLMTVGNDGVATLAGGFSQGEWTFTVYAYNAQGGLMYKGSVTEILSKAKMTGGYISVDVTVIPSYDTTTKTDVAFDITAPKVGTSPSLVYALYDAGGEAVSMTDLVLDSSDKVSFSLTGTLKLTPGTYTLTVVNKDSETVIGGQTITLKVVDKTPLTISGDVASGLYIQVKLHITTKTFGGKVSLKSGNTYHFVQNEDSLTPTDYQWYLNGETVSSDNSKNEFTFNTQTGFGLYYITCVAKYIDASTKEVCSATFELDYE